MSRAAAIVRHLNIASRAMARSALPWVQAAALLFMLALSVFVVKPTSHVSASDVHATFASTPAAPAWALSVGEPCCAGCPGHGWRVPDSVGAAAGPDLVATDAVYAFTETAAASLAIPPPRKPPRADLRVADAG